MLATHHRLTCSIVVLVWGDDLLMLAAGVLYRLPSEFLKCVFTSNSSAVRPCTDGGELLHDLFHKF